jgi:riboflavin synthase
MFTGIIEELGEVKNIRTHSSKSHIQIFAPKIVENLKIGDSVAVNGTCLTMVKVENGCFFADIMPETFRKTNLCVLKIGDKVNLEQALKVSDRLGGHFVLGHVDEVGIILEKKREGNSIILKISSPLEISDYLVPKGSIAVDGISLTVLDVFDDSFTVSIIPHTAKITTLGLKSKGSKLNLEVDIIGKYVKKFMNTKKSSSLTLGLLYKYGYLEKRGAE